MVSSSASAAATSAEPPEGGAGGRVSGYSAAVPARAGSALPTWVSPVGGSCPPVPTLTPSAPSTRTVASDAVCSVHPEPVRTRTLLDEPAVTWARPSPRSRMLTASSSTPSIVIRSTTGAPKSTVMSVRTNPPLPAGVCVPSFAQR
ncbi:hypothetical protein D9V30_13210 [Mycetocola reblochoni]|uniref:Uncharacterized protein n=1 Tax=Mycetocola reblochoni TaxID=331618 RepID=A0A3L6ZI79_9MICO|nr:hypothetical protein D9V30_13210 [Mycetocola reblochoni]